MPFLKHKTKRLKGIFSIFAAMPHSLDPSVVHTYLQHLTSDPSHRYHSWNVCRDAFRQLEDRELLSLHLGFYLASWGMYRGSSGLLQKNHRIHMGAVKIVRSEKYRKLMCTADCQPDRAAIPLILELKSELSEHYTKLNYKRNGKDLKISDTDTLLSKIILGTLGCVPAYDQYFIKGLKVAGVSKREFTAGGLHELFDFIAVNQVILDELAIQYNTPGREHYPVMKMLDMYFWQLGFDSEIA